MSRRQVRKIGNVVALLLSAVATLIGLTQSGCDPVDALVSRGLSGLSLHLFTQMTPPRLTRWTAECDLWQRRQRP